MLIHELILLTDNRKLVKIMAEQIKKQHDAVIFLYKIKFEKLKNGMKRPLFS